MASRADAEAYGEISPASSSCSITESSTRDTLDETEMDGLPQQSRSVSGVLVKRIACSLKPPGRVAVMSNCPESSASTSISKSSAIPPSSAEAGQRDDRGPRTDIQTSTPNTSLNVWRDSPSICKIADTMFPA